MKVPPTADGGVRPWLGLVPYSEEDRDIFHGREQDTEDLLRLVRREVLTVLFGRSGTGKSSLLKAGLFPKLRKERCLPVWIRLEHSGKSGYARQIRAAVREAANQYGMEVEVLNEALGVEDEDFWEYLHRVVFWDPKNQPVTPVLVFDQFEEFFTIGGNGPEIVAFLEELCGLVENHIPGRVRKRVESGEAKLPAGYGDRPYKVMISLREDFVSRLDDLRKDMPSVMHNRHALKPMTGVQALEAVLKPGGVLVDKGVARNIVRFVSAANETDPRLESTANGNADFQGLQVEPALLSLVCSELNLQRIRKGGNKITLEQVQTSGERILDDFYERCLEGMTPTDRAFIEERLVTGGGFRTAVPVEEAVACGLTAVEVEHLIDSRLLRKEMRLGIPHFELTHDVLTRTVTRSRQSRREREQMEELRRKDEAMLREREKAAEEELREAKIRRMKRAGCVATVAALVLGVMAVFTYDSAKKARKSEKEANHSNEAAVRSEGFALKATIKAEARALALKAVDISQSDPELAVLLAIEATIAGLGKDGQGEAAREIELALRTVTRKSLIRNSYLGHTERVYGVEFNATGDRLLTCGGYPESAARIWDVKSGKEIATLDHGKVPGFSGRGMTVSCARFSPDGKRVVTSTYQDGGHVYLWDVSGIGPSVESDPVILSKPLEFPGHTDWVTSVAFRPRADHTQVANYGSDRVASGGRDNVIRLWDPETRKEVEAPLEGHTGWIRSLVFSKNGKKVLSASYDGTARLWTLEPGEDGVLEPPVVFDAIEGEGKRENLHAADLSPNGRWVVTGGNDNILRVWDVVTATQVATHSHPAPVMGVAFIDDKRLVSTCNDTTIRFWELTKTVEGAEDKDEEIKGITEDGQIVEDLEGTKISEKPARYLNLIASQRGHEGWIRAVAVSPDKRFIATSSQDKTVRRWSLPQGGEVGVLGGYGRGYYWSADAWSESGGLTVFAGMGDGRIRALDGWTELPVPDWREEGPGHTDSVRSISLSPDGKRLVSSSQDQTAIVWDAGTGKSLFTISGHKGEEGGTVYHARFSPDGKRIVTASNDGTAAVWSADEKADGKKSELLLIPGTTIINKGGIKNAKGLAAKLSAREEPESELLWQLFSKVDRDALDVEDEKNLRVVLARLLNKVVSGNRLIDEPAFQQSEPGDRRAWIARAGSDAVVNRLLLGDAFGEFLSPYPPTVYDARFSEDGQRIVTADFESRSATVWDARDGKPLLVLSNEIHGDSVVGAAFSPEGEHVVTACTDGFCRVWDSDTGELLKSMPHRVGVRSAEYSADGQWILTSAEDGVARLWSVPDYQPRSELRGHSDTSPEARFSQDGRYIITSSRDGTVRVCYTDPWDLYSLATHRVTRKLTLEERENFKVKRPLSGEEQRYYHEEEKGR